MIARRSVWSDERVVRLLASFVPVADEVGRLQRGKDEECRFFQSFAEKGHYGGRTQPTDTRQGIYAVAPSGVFLASINTSSAEAVAGMLERALAAWKDLPAEQRLLAEPPAEETGAQSRAEARFPAGGAVLRVTARDLPRATPPAGRPGDWRLAAWNEDWAWLKPDEVLALCAAHAGPEAGDSWSVDAEIARRFARAQLLDFVRGQTPPFKQQEVEHAELRVHVLSIKAGIASLRLEGRSRASASGKWSVGEAGPATAERTRGLELEWLGFARWNAHEKRLEHMEILATGTRWGGTRYNGRADDLEPAPIGFHFALVERAPAQLVAPAHFSSYGW